MKQLSTKEAIESRRSIRKFQSTEVSDQIIYELLESARFAPSGCNAQPWRFKIVNDFKTKRSYKNCLQPAFCN